MSGQPEGTLVVPHANWRGRYEAGSTSTGALQSTCAGASGCPVVTWPGATVTVDGAVPQGQAATSWMGSLMAQGTDGSGLQYRRHRYYNPQTGQFTQADPIGLAGGSNLYGFAAGDPINFSDPLGLCPNCRNELSSRYNDEEQKFQAALTPSDRVAMGAMVLGAAAGGFAIMAATASSVAASAAALGPALTQVIHGAQRLADRTRLSPGAARDVMQNATRQMTQGDGANVFIKEVGGRFNVVVQGERGVVTTFKNLSQRAMDRLAKNYDWSPK